jgi:hypothetical protein
VRRTLGDDLEAPDAVLDLCARGVAYLPFFPLAKRRPVEAGPRGDRQRDGRRYLARRVRGWRGGGPPRRAHHRARHLDRRHDRASAGPRRARTPSSPTAAPGAWNSIGCALVEVCGDGGAGPRDRPSCSPCTTHGCPCSRRWRSPSRIWRAAPTLRCFARRRTIPSSALSARSTDGCPTARGRRRGTCSWPSTPGATSGAPCRRRTSTAQ